MTYLSQLAIIIGITYASEVIVNVFKIPFPGSVLGMLVLFACLKLKWIKLSSIKESGEMLLNHLPIMFVPLGVGIYQYADHIKNEAVALIAIIMVTTVIVMSVTGLAVQRIKRKSGDSHVI